MLSWHSLSLPFRTGDSSCSGYGSAGQRSSCCCSNFSRFGLEWPKHLKCKCWQRCRGGVGSNILWLLLLQSAGRPIALDVVLTAPIHTTNIHTLLMGMLPKISCYCAMFINKMCVRVTLRHVCCWSCLYVYIYIFGTTTEHG